jgi:hypothetical protein
VRVGMQAGLAALAVWSFLMATAHGAGLMLWPVLMPLCFSAAPQPFPIGPLPTALLGIAVHTLAMLTVTTAIAVAVYEWIGLEILQRAWLNVAGALRQWLKVPFCELAKRVGDGTGRVEHDRAVSDRPAPESNTDHVHGAVGRPRAIPLPAPGRRFSSSSPSGSSSCKSQQVSRCDTEIASSEIVFSPG